MSTAFLIDESTAHQKILETLSQIAPMDAEVLLSGPSGVGKEVYAHYVHQCSPRSAAAFVPVNCSVLPADLLENELFGHVRGVFAGARPHSEGLVEAAEGGTLFFDGVDALTLGSQIKLVRFLQEKEYRRLGETRLRRANVRIIAATNTDLLAAVHDGRFREDLFCRLRVVPIGVDWQVTNVEPDSTKISSNDAQHEVVDYFEYEYIEGALQQSGGNIVAAAEQSWKLRRMFLAMMRKHGSRTREV